MKQNRPLFRLALVLVMAVVCGALTPATANAAFGVEGRLEIVRPPGAFQFDAPQDIAADAAGNVYVLWPGRVQKYSPSGAVLATWGGFGSAPGQFFPTGPYARSTRALDLDGLGHVYVVDEQGNRIVKFTTDGAFVANFGRNGGDGSAGRGPGEFDVPQGVTSDASGNLYVWDYPDFRSIGPTPPGQLQKLAPDGTVLRRRATGQVGPLVAGPPGRLYSRVPHGVEAVLYADEDQLFSEVPLRFDGFSLLPGARPDNRGNFIVSCCGAAFVDGRLWVARSAINTIEAYGPGGGLQRACPMPDLVQELAAGRDGRLYVLAEGSIIRYGEAAQPCDVEPPSVTMALSQVVLRASSYRRLRKARLSIETSEQGTAEVTFTRLVDGRRVRGRCVRLTRRNVRRARCLRRRVVEERFDDIRAYVGANNQVRLVDLLWRRRLPAGRYEIALVVEDRAGLRSQPERARVRITR